MKKNKVKIILYLIVIIFIVISFYVFKDTFALFEDEGFGVVNNDIGAWVIKLSNQVITGTNIDEIVIDSFVYDTNPHVESGYIAPGGSAYFDLIFDATDCDVAVRYDITFKYEEMDYAENISVTVEEVGNNNIIKTDVNTYSGVISLASINNEDLITLRVHISWDDLEDYNEADTELGSAAGSKLRIPIEVSAIQYLGETITPYVEPNEGD
ncbi:MAG: hypothetical protein IKR57_05965 [Bacilli bacterium]|nr:hypothetical protein [Bacilli bacterium]